MCSFCSRSCLARCGCCAPAGRVSGSLGLLALSLYYVGLKATPAARATLAELAFPVTAALIGVSFLGASLSVTVWVGLVVVVGSVSALGWHERARGETVVVERVLECA